MSTVLIVVALVVSALAFSEQITFPAKPNEQRFDHFGGAKVFRSRKSSEPFSVHPSYPVFHEISQHSSLIPNRILRTWKTSSRAEIEQMSLNGSDHPLRYQWFKTWDEKNPGAMQIVFSDDDMDKFVRGSFSKRVQDAYFKLPKIVLRADFMRYMMLYELGGVYSDMDTSCKEPIQKWNLGIPEVAVIVGVEDPGFSSDSAFGQNIDSIQQWTMAAAPHHPFMSKVVNAVTEKIHSLTEAEMLNADVLELTGPGIWKKVAWEHIRSLGGNLEASANLWNGYRLYGDFLVLGKSFLNADQSHNPDALMSHHFTGFTQFGWRHQNSTFVEQTKKQFSLENVTEPVSTNDIEIDALQSVREVISVEPISSRSQNIPKVIFRVANSSDHQALMPRHQEFHQEWILTNPSYQVKLYSASDIDKFVRETFKSDADKQFSTAFFRLPKLRQRVEFFKFLHLSKIGGYYSEIDTRIHAPVDRWSLGKTNVGLILGFRGQHHSRPSVSTAAIASVPEHPIIQEYIAFQAAHILNQTAEELQKISFASLFPERFSLFLLDKLHDVGFNATSDLKSLSWTGFIEFEDVILHGNERFEPSRDIHSAAFIKQHSQLWGTVWEENFLAE
ncbi:membrane-bound alpha-1,6- mannosyltransferase Initiation-specific [Entophlyctis luteolus]|nr:membrane-bound alpha-1,6- mannosyltransferase Initiation-specific [Entophlyctis luteolus]